MENYGGSRGLQALNEGEFIAPLGSGLCFSLVFRANTTVVLKACLNYVLLILSQRKHIGAWVTPPGGTRHYVQDKTGLTGKYDFNLAFDQGGSDNITVGSGVLAEGGRPPEPEASGLPTFSRAIEKQLGLKLVKAPDIPMDTLVIDHAERIPLGN